MDKGLSNILKELRRYGLLLESDKFLPSVVGTITGKKISRSWWGHKKGNEIFRALHELSDRKDVLMTKLISGKVTFIHKKLWMDFLTVANSNELWQLEALSNEASKLLKMVNKKGIIHTEKLPKNLFNTPNKIGAVVRELEKRILVYSFQTHTDMGAHAKTIENWAHWMRRKKIPSKQIVSVQDAKAKFENLVSGLNRKFGGNGKLPWARMRPF